MQVWLAETYPCCLFLLKMAEAMENRTYCTSAGEEWLQSPSPSPLSGLLGFFLFFPLFFLPCQLTGHCPALLWGVSWLKQAWFPHKALQVPGCCLLDFLAKDRFYKKLLEIRSHWNTFFFFPVPPQHRCLWLSLILRQHALPFCIVCFGLSFRTIICKLQFLVLVYMQRLHWFN